jgi:hypothetical protein
MLSRGFLRESPLCVLILPLIARTAEVLELLLEAMLDRRSDPRQCLKELGDSWPGDFWNRCVPPLVFCRRKIEL